MQSKTPRKWNQESVLVCRGSKTDEGPFFTALLKCSGSLDVVLKMDSLHSTPPSCPKWFLPVMAACF